MTRPLLTLILIVVLGLAAINAPAPAPRPRAAAGDIALFQEIVAKLRNGAAYYPTFGDALRQNNYPAGQALNWRTPLHLVAIASVPEVVCRTILIAVGGLLVAVTLTIALRDTPQVAVITVIMQLGVAAMISAPPAIFMGEAWAGLLIGLSTAAYALSRHTLAISFAMLALFFRELAAPYYMICGIAAVTQNRWRAVKAWIAGLGAYAIYYGWHLRQLSDHQLPTDVTHRASWVQFGGLPFLLSTVQWNAWLTALPPFFTALALAMILVGIANPRTPMFVRITSATYAAFFLMVGHGFNHYWGLVAWPTWAIAAGFGADDALQSWLRMRAGLRS